MLARPSYPDSFLPSTLWHPMTQSASKEATSEPHSGATAARQLLRAGNLQEALEAAQTELIENPDDIDSLYCQAVAQRYLGRPEEALQTLEKLKAANPNFAKAFQEEGHNRKQMGDPIRARNAYQRAVELNRALIGLPASTPSSTPPSPPPRAPTPCPVSGGIGGGCAGSGSMASPMPTRCGAPQPCWDTPTQGFGW